MSIYQKELSKIDDIILLTYGESDLPPSKDIILKGINSLIEDSNKYQDPQGLLSLRKTIAKKINFRYKNDYCEENVLICNGATEALFLVLSSLINKGDEVLLINPVYPSYEAIITYLEGKVKYVNYDENFEVDLKDLKKKINSKIKAIIFNYPNNPTGSVLSKEKIIEIKKLILKYKIHFILDNVYEELIFDDDSYSLNEDENLNKYRIIINSLSKSQRLTGWRLGYLIADQEIIKLCTKLHQEINICLPAFMMNTMKFALNCDTDLDYYKNNLLLIKHCLDKLKIKYFLPKGGIYICFSIEEFNLSSIDFCNYFANNYKLGLMPGSFFNLEGYVRLCFASKKEKIISALKRLKIGIKNLR